MKEILSTNDIALLQNVSDIGLDRYGLGQDYKDSTLVLAKPGRPFRSITNEELSSFLFTYNSYPFLTLLLHTLLH